MTAQEALERANKIWESAPKDPDWSAVPSVARALIDARIEALKWVLVGPRDYITQERCCEEIVCLGEERKKLK